ncbi:MAG: hypothetical protein LBV00_00870 [Propionibacteriaceae bacterium]|nr:hypothetical protein [Propionibacteriaceae bacterium]
MTVTIVDDNGVEQQVSVPGDLYHLFHGRGFDEGSILAFAQAASMTSVTDAPLLGDIGTILKGFEKEQADYEALPWWKKYGHQILEGLSALTGLAGIFIPGPGWLATGLAFASFTVAAVDAAWYFGEGDWKAGLLAGATLLLPIGGGALARVTVEQVALLKGGHVITILGGRYKLVRGSLIAIVDGTAGANRVRTALADATAVFLTKAGAGIPSISRFVGAVELDGAGCLTSSSVRVIATLSTQNPGSDIVVFGKWGKGSAESYEQVALRSDATYFDMGEAFNEIKAKLPLSDDAAREEMWRINQQFLDDQIKQGKTFVFTEDPRGASKVAYR